MGSCDLWRRERASSYRSRRGGTGTPMGAARVAVGEVGRGAAVGVDEADEVGPTVGDAGLPEGRGCAVVGEARVAAGAVVGEPPDGVVVAGSWAGAVVGGMVVVVAVGESPSDVGGVSTVQATSRSNPANSASRPPAQATRKTDDFLVMTFRPICRHGPDTIGIGGRIAHLCMCIHRTAAFSGAMQGLGVRPNSNELSGSDGLSDCHALRPQWDRQTVAVLHSPKCC